MTNLDSILKNRYYLLRKVHTVKGMVSLEVMYRCESWTMKKTECQRIDTFGLWLWRKLLRVSWTARSKHSILKEINPEYSLEGLMLTLKLQYFGHLVWRADSLERTLLLGKIEGRRRRGGQRTRWLNASWTQWTWVWANSGKQWKTGKTGVLQSIGWQRGEHYWVTEQQIMRYQCVLPEQLKFKTISYQILKRIWDDYSSHTMLMWIQNGTVTLEKVGSFL